MKAATPLVSSEIFAGVNISCDKHVRQLVLMRGVTPIAYQVHRNMHLVSGHWPTRGHGEWVIGQKIQARQPYMTVGSQFPLRAARLDDRGSFH